MVAGIAGEANYFHPQSSDSHRSPIPLATPYQRVIGLDGKLHGYGGGEGLKTKEWLLKMEGAVIA